MAIEPADIAARAAATLSGPVRLEHWLTVLPVVVSIGFGALLVALRQALRWQAPLCLVGLLAVLALDVALLRQVVESGPVSMVMGNWRPPFGIAFTVDALGASFALVGGFVTLACAIRALVDFDTAQRRFGAYPFLMLISAGVQGAFLTGDLFNLYVWFEVFVIASFGLLVLGSTRVQLDAAIKYAVLNLVATTLFLSAIAMLYGTFGTLNMADLARTARAADAATAGPLVTIGVLMLFALAMKAAVFPLNVWLPAAYHAPPVAVSALFGGLLTKIGLYALIRIFSMILPAIRAELAPVIAAAAIATMLTGALGALAQTDIRRAGAFLLIGGIGVALSGVGLGGEPALGGSIAYGLQSMIAVAGVFLLAGVMADRGGSFDLRRLGGLSAAAPWLFAPAMIVLLAASGLPPTSGLWPKIMLVKAAIGAGAWWTTAAILANSLITTIVVARIVLFAFWRPASADAVCAGLPPRAGASVALIATVVPILAIGLWPQPLLDLAQRAAQGVIDPTAYGAAVFSGTTP